MSLVAGGWRPVNHAGRDKARVTSGNVRGQLSAVEEKDSCFVASTVKISHV